MPAGDGTGPLGMGPGTGRGKGGCRAGIGPGNTGRVMFRGKSGWMRALAAPAIIAAVRDLANPKGLLRQLGSALLGKRRTEDKRRIRQNAEYAIGDDKTHAAFQNMDSNGKKT